MWSDKYFCVWTYILIVFVIPWCWPNIWNCSTVKIKYINKKLTWYYYYRNVIFFPVIWLTGFYYSHFPKIWLIFLAFNLIYKWFINFNHLNYLFIHLFTTNVFSSIIGQIVTDNVFRLCLICLLMFKKVSALFVYSLFQLTKFG